VHGRSPAADQGIAINPTKDSQVPAGCGQFRWVASGARTSPPPARRDSAPGGGAGQPHPRLTCTHMITRPLTEGDLDRGGAPDLKSPHWRCRTVDPATGGRVHPPATPRRPAAPGLPRCAGHWPVHPPRRLDRRDRMRDGRRRLQPGIGYRAPTSRSPELHRYAWVIG
jgi:hypothetical protein